MTIEQTIEVPANRRITIDLPEDVPSGRAHLIIQFPIKAEVQISDTVPLEAKGQIKNEAFRCALRSAYGAWKDRPWTNHLEDINAMRDEWDHRDPWNKELEKQHLN